MLDSVRPAPKGDFWDRSDLHISVVGSFGRLVNCGVTIDARGVAFGCQITVTVAREHVLQLTGTGGHAVHWVFIDSPVDSAINFLQYDDFRAEAQYRKTSVRSAVRILVPEVAEEGSDDANDLAFEVLYARLAKIEPAIRDFVKSKIDGHATVV